MLHGVGKTDFYQSVWCVVHAVNTCPQLQLMFPKSQQDCEDLATEFIGHSHTGFNNYVGCIDGMLLCMEKPSKQQCVEAGVDSGKFYCGRKGKYRLNLQVVCDACHQFIDVSLQHPVTEVCQILEVSWQMCHAWIAHWTVARATLTMSRRRSTCDERTHGRNAREPPLART